MGLFSLWNYEDYLLHLFINSSFTRKGLVLLCTYLVTTVVRFHLSMALCILFYQANPTADFVIPIVISVLTSMTSDALFQYSSTHKPRYEAFVNYIITNYSAENFIRWKRIFLTSVLLYIFGILILFRIDNYNVSLGLIQTTISCIICDFLEQRLPQTYYNQLLNWWHRPNVTKFQTELMLIDNYRVPIKRRHSFDEHRVKSVKKLPPKPPTPPLKKKENKLD